MRPILFEVFGIELASWYVFFALAGVAVYFWSRFLLSKRFPNLVDEVPTLFAICYVAGWFGARTFSLVVEQPEVRTVGHFLSELVRIGPMTFYGGGIGAFVCGLAYVLIKRLPVGIFADVGFPAGAIGLGLGRIGCFLNGDDFGLPVPDQANPPWWSNTFPNLADGIARYPVQLEEALFSFLLAGVASFLFLRFYPSNLRPTQPYLEKPTGLVACVVVMASAANRFVNEAYRADERGQFFNTALSTSQGVALVLFCSCFACIFLILNVHKRRLAQAARS